MSARFWNSTVADCRSELLWLAAQFWIEGERYRTQTPLQISRRGFGRADVENNPWRDIRCHHNGTFTAFTSFPFS